MRLWHQDLINKLPQKQLCGQWRECIALLGNGWGKKHSVVNYVFEHDESYLFKFTGLVFNEMIKRGYHPNIECATEAMLRRHNLEEALDIISKASKIKDGIIYPEHNKEYYKECLENLKKKGIEVK